MKREEHFDIGERGELFVYVASSDLVLTEGEPGRIDVVLEGKESALDLFDITHVGDLVTIELGREHGRRWLQPRVWIAVSLPTGSDVEVKTVSGDIHGAVDTGELFISTASGNVRFNDVSNLARIKSASGDVLIGDVAGDLHGVIASGDIRIDTVFGELSVSTASGDVFVDEAAGRTVVKSASGDVNIGRFSGTSLSLASMSGDVNVGLAPRMCIDAKISTLSGSLRNNITPSEEETTIDATLRIKTMSGDITLR